MSPLERLQAAGADAYDFVDRLPRGPARVAAWDAYAFQTYGDKLIAACETTDELSGDTVEIVTELFSLVEASLLRASEFGAAPSGGSATAPCVSFPRWHTPIRSVDQLHGMRAALDALHAYVTLDVRSLRADEATLTPFRQALAEIDKHLATVDILWIRNPPDEIRGGIGDALTDGLDTTHSLGQAVAQVVSTGPSDYPS